MQNALAKNTFQGDKTSNGVGRNFRGQEQAVYKQNRCRAAVK